MKSDDVNARERVRLAIKRRLDRLGMSGREFGRHFTVNEGRGHGDQWVSNLLRGKFSLSLEELDEAARALKCRASDLVKDDTEEAMFLGPTEQRLIRALRDVPPVIRDHFLTMVEYVVGVAPEEIEYLLEFRQLTPEEQAKVRHWTYAVRMSQGPAPRPEAPADQREKGARPTAVEQRNRAKRHRQR